MLQRLLLALFALAAADVEEVSDERTFKKILADNPAVAVDFFSHTCGPCIMIAPKFKDLAREYDGKVKFIKVDVQRNNVGVQIRSMPTFHFYVQGKLEHQFAGADENGMRQSVAQIARKAEAMDIELSLGALEAFYQKHDPSKLEGVDEIYEKYPAYKLVQILKKKYGAAPEFTKKNKPPPPGGGGGKKEKEEKGVDIKKMDLDDLKAEVYRRENAIEAKEKELMAKKNSRRRDKVVQQCGGEDGPSKAVKLAVVGGGPGGMTAAIYAARAGLKPLVVAPAMGGQLMSKGVNVENYPGIYEASGGDIVKLMKRQAMRYSATFEEEAALSVDLSSRPFKIVTNASTVYAHSLVIATGADSRWLDVPGEEDLKGGGVSSCATCDGFLFSGKPVVVVGGGDTAMEDALVLARTSSSVTLIHRRDSFRASKVLQQAVLANAKITVMWNSSVKEFKAGEGGMLGQVLVQSVDDPSNVTELAAEAAFVAIGHIPNTWLFKGQLEMTSNDYLVTKPGTTHCSVPGVFAAGDVADWVYRQAVTSAGSGSSAALDAERWLSEQMVSVGSDEPDAEEEAEKCHPEDYETWTMKQIRKELKDRGVDAAAECRGCMEKSQFIEVLCRHM
jgi:thioredoxin reductase (NADPH)